MANFGAVARSWRVTLGLLLVSVQLGVVLATHLPPTCCASRYFAWAPNDYSVDYFISATVNGRRLNRREIWTRYRVSQRGFYEDPPERLIRYLRRYELTYGRHDRTSLSVRYQLNGRPPVVWTWSDA